MQMGPNAALVGRMQIFQFPTFAAPTTSRGMSLAVKDFTATLGLGLSYTW
jgi:hypothetical protein